MRTALVELVKKENDALKKSAKEPLGQHLPMRDPEAEAAKALQYYSQRDSVAAILHVGRPTAARNSGNRLCDRLDWVAGMLAIDAATTPPSTPIARRGSLPFVHHMRQS
jgi:hypothetical protein